MRPGWALGTVGHCNLEKKLETLKLQTAEINIFYHRAFTRVSLKN